MNRKFSLGVCISLIAIACSVTFVITMRLSQDIYNRRIAGVGEREAIYTKMQEIDSYVRNKFIGAIDEERLITAIMSGYMAGLGDERAGYMTDLEYYELSQIESGRIITAGVRVSRDESGYVRIDEVYEGSSAALQGIRADDLIIQIDGTPVLEIGAENAIKRLQGEEGARVILTTRREGVDRRFTLIRQNVELITVRGVNHGEFGFMRITGLSENTGVQFEAALDEILNNGARGLIIDIRGLSGNLLTPFRQISERLLPAGASVIAEYRNGNIDSIIEVINDSRINIPITVITDINTTSGGELLAALLRDYADAQLVGATTRGDAVFTTTQVLRDGSAVVLSVMKLRSNGGTDFDGEGIRPDYPVELITPMETDLGNLEFTADTQIQKAFEITETTIQENVAENGENSDNNQ